MTGRCGWWWPIEDPGVANWLDTAGHSEGPIILRCVRTDTAPVPTTRLVSFDRLAEELPSGHPTGLTERAGRGHRHSPEGRKQAVRPMSLDVDRIEQDARIRTGPGDPGGDRDRKGLEQPANSTDLGDGPTDARFDVRR